LGNRNIVLAGNPNCGKTTIFNLLTGLNQKTGNFPGVTVDKKHAVVNLENLGKVNIIDLPGCYNLYPTAYDEKVVFKILANPNDNLFPDLIVYIADATQLERHLLLFTQLKDLGVPIILGLNMQDLAEARKIKIDAKGLEKSFGTPVVWLNGRTGHGLNELKTKISEMCSLNEHPTNNFQTYVPDAKTNELSEKIVSKTGAKTKFQALLTAHHVEELQFLNEEQKEYIKEQTSKLGFDSLHSQIDETMQRYRWIEHSLVKHQSLITADGKNKTHTLDRILTHRVWGPLIFISILLLIFQAVFSWAEWPMQMFETGIIALTELVQNHLPAGWFTELLVDGILPGLGGVLVFIPQIAILFLFTSFLEELGYMARAIYLFDRLLLKFGLNGRSIISLVSGAACAIPAIMSARTINNWKERLITIMVTPLISCSARLPVFAVLISFIITDNTFFGPIGMRSLILFLLYSLGLLAALVAAIVFKKLLKTNETSFLMIELPEYKVPHWKSILLAVKSKVQSFISEAGMIIMVISVALWFLASFGPGNEIESAQKQATEYAASQNMTPEETENLKASAKIENSYAGHIGKFIEPAIVPLGFDWKIGIALITSFAAREVFIGTMSTIYSIGSGDEDPETLQKRMSKEINANTGQKTFTIAASMSLLIFYLFAMQCMSTLAVVRKETGTWKWPLIQLIYMSALAYFGSWITYVLLS